MKQYFKDKYITIKDWLKQEKWFILLLALMTVSLFVSMFTEYALIACIVLTIVCSILFNFEQNLGFFLFSQAFEAVLILFAFDKYLPVYTINYFIIFFTAGLKHLINVIKKKEKIKLNLLIILAIIIFYILITINSFNPIKIAKLLIFLSFIYLYFSKTKKIKFDNILIWSCVGLVLSIIFENFAYRSERMINIMGVFFSDGVRKTQAMFTNPNTYIVFAVLMLACILYKTISEDIFWIIPFAVIFPHSYATMSRNYILSFIFAFVLICIFVCIKHKKTYFFRYFICLVLMIGVCFSQINISKVYANRMIEMYNEFYSLIGVDKKIDKIFTDIQTNKDSFENLKPKPESPTKPSINPGTQENTKPNTTPDGENGKWIDGTPIDPGRSGIWKRYLKDYTSSTKTIFFGRGLDADMLGVAAHNSFIEMIWKYGVIGIILFSGVFYFIAKELIKGKSFLSLILLGQIGLINLFETCVFFEFMLMMLLLVGASRSENKITEKIVDNTIQIEEI